ncbi:hypothetical protein [Deinococcus sp. UYEF24]
MKSKFQTSLLAVPLLLAACAQPSATVPVVTQPPVATSPTLLGYIEVTAGKQDGTAPSVQWVEPTANGLRPLALAQVPLNLQLHGDQNVTWSFDDGKTRYLATTLDVRNLASTPQDTKNVYFLAMDTPQTIGDTAISSILNDDGQRIADLDVARHIFPTHGVIPPGQVQQPSADFVAFSEDEITQLKPAQGNVLFPWGFGVRHCLSVTCDKFNRTIPASDARNSYDAIVTFAFQAPVLSSAKTPDAVRAVYAVYKDVGANPRLSQSLQEQAAGTVAGLPSIPSGFFATKFPGSTLQGGGWLSNLRISGTPSNPTSLMLPPSTTTPTPPADPCPGASGTPVTCFSPVQIGGFSDALGVDAQGRILVAGTTVSNFNGQKTLSLSRYTADGKLDSSFGTGGTVTLTDQRADALIVTPDGRIIVVGGNSVLQFTTSGALDTTFGTGGIALTNLTASAVALSADNKIVVAGSTVRVNSDTTTSFDFAVARFTSAGKPDTTFGTGGQVVTHLAGYSAQATAVAVTGEGKVVITGLVDDPANGLTNPHQKFTVVRYTPAGSLDSSFGTNGVVFTSFGGTNEPSKDLALTATGGIIVLGTSDVTTLNSAVLAKYTSSGQLDTSFGTGGKTVLMQPTNFGLPSFYFTAANSLTLARDGKILVVGTNRYSLYFNDTNYMTGVVRFTPSGQVDTTFGTQGFIKPTVPNRNGPQGRSILETLNGKILVAGTYAGSSNNSGVLEEINP